MALAWAAILGAALFSLPTEQIAVGAVLGFLALEALATSRLTRLHLTVGASLVGAVWLVSDAAGQDFLAAAFRASFIMVLFSSLGMLQNAVMRNQSFIAAGEMLVRQPPGRQYYALSGGTTLFGSVLNFGVLPLMGGLVKAAQPGASPAQEKRLMLALLRGFSVVMFWCPLTVAYAITTTTIEGLDWPLMTAAGICLAMLVIGLGRRFNMASGAQAKRQVTEPFRWPALFPILALLVGLSALAALVDILTPAALVHGVILFVPLTAIFLFWLFDPASARAEATRYLGEDIAMQRNEVAVLGNAALSGALIATLLPQQTLLALLGSALPVVLVPALCLWVVVLLGQAGLNPLITVAALASILARPASIGIDPTLMGLALVVGWGLAVGSSSAAAATMSIGRVVDESAWRVGTAWNGLFTLVASLMAGGVLTLLGFVMHP